MGQKNEVIGDIVVEHISPGGEASKLYCFFQEVDKFTTPRLSSRVNLREYAKKLAGKADLFYAMSGETICGECAIYLNNKPVAFITSIHLLPEHRGLGIGSMLMENIIRVLSDKAYEKIELKVHCQNHKAINFYEKFQFYTVITEGEWITMERNLEATK